MFLCYAAAHDSDGVRELAENLSNKDRAIQAGCIKVLYEVGYLEPELVAPFALDFLRLLKSRNNRLVWGGMVALSTVAMLAADVLYPHWGDIRRSMELGLVITRDAGVLTLARIASTSSAYGQEIFPSQSAVACCPINKLIRLDRSVYSEFQNILADARRQFRG